MADPVASDWRWWRERRPSAGPLHLDTAAAGRSSLATLAAAAAYAEREATTGAYVALLRVSPHVDCTAEDLDRFRQALTALG
jgi:hercynylcysteine S-oxide lyase